MTSDEGRLQGDEIEGGAEQAPEPRPRWDEMDESERPHAPEKREGFLDTLADGGRWVGWSVG